MAIFQRGLSGLTAAQRSIETISNNVANSQTVGFKRADTLFADMYSNTTSGLNSPGQGVQVSDIKQDFSQGAITLTNSNTDLAIDGTGFFKVTGQDGQTLYSRNGQFSLDRDGFLVNAQGQNLQATRFDETLGRAVGETSSLQIPKGPMPPKFTERVDYTINFDSSADPIDPALNAFDPLLPETYNHSTSITVFDNTGVAKVLTTYFQKQPEADPANPQPGDTWLAFATLDGAPVQFDDGTGSGTGTDSIELNFLANGLPDPASIDEFSRGILLPSDADSGNPFGEPTVGANNDLTLVEYDLSKATQFGGRFQVVALSQDGFESGDFLNQKVTGDGRVVLTYTNNQQVTIAQIPLFNFTNPNGLIPVGGNAFVRHPDAGEELNSLVNRFDARAQIVGGAVEDSNVDLTKELVDMISTQRVYQANSSSISTQDQMLQVAIGLRN